MSSDTNAIHFFKIILKCNLRDGELRIPRSFVKKYGKELSNPVHLRLPNGADWEVCWIKRDSDIWFQKGWRRFAEIYSLSHGHFLVFRYEGRSHFQVLIFDMSALEIDYSSIRCTNDGEKNSKHYEEVEESDGSVEILHESERPRSPLPYSQSRKKMKTNPNGEPISYFNPYFETEDGQSQRTKFEKTKTNEGFDATQKKVTGTSRRGLFNAKNCSKTEAIKKKEALEDTESNRALERARNFRSENPVFIRTLPPTYLQKDFLVIPSKFSRKYLDGLEGTANIWISEDRTWPVRFKFSISSNRTIMSTGWMSFAQEYNLKDGDVCVFEMTECSPVSFKIIIFRDREEPSSEQLQGYGHQTYQLNQEKPNRGPIQNMESSSLWNGQFGERKSSEGISRSCPKSDVLGNSESPKAASKCMEENKFMIFVKDFHLKNTTPHIPNKFMKRYIRCHAKEVTLKVGEILWPLKVIYYPDFSNGRFSAGWTAFVRGCNLKPGDICVCEMIDEENLVLNVSISRHHH